MEITVIDRRDFVGWMDSATRFNEIYMTNTTSMVNNVLNAAGRNLITRLNILDHGNRQTMQIGDDVISNDNLSRFRGTLSRLTGHFEGGVGFVHLQHCFIGNNTTLLRALARIWQVPVYAGTGLQRSVARVQDGVYVRCDPNGICYENVPRPRVDLRFLLDRD